MPAQTRPNGVQKRGRRDPFCSQVRGPRDAAGRAPPGLPAPAAFGPAPLGAARRGTRTSPGAAPPSLSPRRGGEGWDGARTKAGFQPAARRPGLQPLPAGPRGRQVVFLPRSVRGLFSCCPARSSAALGEACRVGMASPTSPPRFRANGGGNAAFSCGSWGTESETQNVSGSDSETCAGS